MSKYKLEIGSDSYTVELGAHEDNIRVDGDIISRPSIDR